MVFEDRVEFAPCLYGPNVVRVRFDCVSFRFFNLAGEFVNLRVARGFLFTCQLPIKFGSLAVDLFECGYSLIVASNKE
jgi:hypothetical protein